MSTPVNTSAAILALSKVAWRLSISLSNLLLDAKPGHTALLDLAGEVRSLGNECYQIHLKLQEIANNTETGSPPPYDGDGRIWASLAIQIQETSQTIQELESFEKSFKAEEREDSSPVFQSAQLEKSENKIEEMENSVRRHSDNLRTTLLLIQTVLAHFVPSGVERTLGDDVAELVQMVKKLQRLSQTNRTWRHTQTEATLMQYAQEAIVKGTATKEQNLVPGPMVGASAGETIDTSDPPWTEVIVAIQKEQKEPESRDSIPKSVPRRMKSVIRSRGTNENPQPREMSDSDDDLDTDFAKSALSTGAQAFEARNWDEADSMLQEALNMLQQLPRRRREFCDIFDLHYMLAVCAYHIQDPADAEKALHGFISQSATSDQQKEYIYNAMHLLSQLYIRQGNVDRARIECEISLQARRRLLGKLSGASLESMALMAHIYVLLGNRARAKSCLAMIPEESREAVLRTVEGSLATDVEHLEFSSLLSRAVPRESEVAIDGAPSRLSTSTIDAPSDHHESDAASAMMRSPAAGPWRLRRSLASEDKTFEDSVSFLERSPPMTGTVDMRPPDGRERTQQHTPILGKVDPTGTSQCGPEIPKNKTLSRKEILNKVGCQPRDRTEEAVCKGDLAALATILSKKKGFWKSNLRKRGRPERVTALHFAALFGEIDMAQRLIEASFDVNEVPFGYSTRLTPLNFAIGARQVAMVSLLTANGAKPAHPDTWSTLAGQLLSRSWLMKTMSDSERDLIPSRITAIMDILLKCGWNIDAPISTTAGTMLHQAVSFWTGAYKWDLNLRAAVTSFLCERGASPFEVNGEGKTAYDLAAASEHHDLVRIFEACVRRKELLGTSAMPVELPGQIPW
ncbi:Ank-2 multi-domain protein [Pyrenophora teres f. maculata]|nr:Ank-2 multi-domain protein [Pyrenophora teres f. maculata]